MNRTEQQADDDFTRMAGANDANLAHYVYDATGQVRGRCRGHSRGEHHRLCPGSVAELADLRARHAALCEQINEKATPFRESPNRVACEERDRLWRRIEELSDEEDE